MFFSGLTLEYASASEKEYKVKKNNNCKHL